MHEDGTFHAALTTRKLGDGLLCLVEDDGIFHSTQRTSSVMVLMRRMQTLRAIKRTRAGTSKAAVTRAVEMRHSSAKK